jgi:hypothetical protein
MTDFKVAALGYLRKGLVVIPCEPKGKKPLVAWKEFEHRRPTEEEVVGWWTRWPDANIGIVTGPLSRLLALDIDGAEGEASVNGRVLPVTPTALSGDGRHLYLRYPGANAKTASGVLKGVDIRAAGGLIIAPPSRHENGAVYQWTPGQALGEIALAAPPDWLLALATGRTTEVAPVNFSPLDTLGHVLETGDEDIHWLVEGLATEGSVSFIAGPPKLGKSWLALYIAFCIAHGLPVLGKFKVERPRKVILVEEEDSALMVKLRFKAIARGLGLEVPPSDRLSFAIRRGFLVDNAEWRDWLIAETKRLGADLIIFDVLNKLHSRDENVAYEAGKVIRDFEGVRRATGAGLLILHHFRKESAAGSFKGQTMLRGSSAFSGWLENALYLTGRPGRRGQVYVEPESKWTGTEPFVYSLDIENYPERAWKPFRARFTFEGEVRAMRDGNLETLYQAIVKNFDQRGLEGCTVKSLKEVVGRSENTVRKWAEALVNAGRVNKQQVPGRKGDKSASYTPVLEAEEGTAAAQDS